MSRRIAFALLAVIVLLAAGLPGARAQAQDDAAVRDHLKCYQITDSLQSTRYLADLRNQFGLEPGCSIVLPARLLCAETEKTIISSPAPPGGGPAGTPAGHFLCYLVSCPNSPDIPDTRVEDQFGRRVIAFGEERLLCAPANKLICGDGDLDPGEACDPGSAATNVCPDGTPCRPDCQCSPPPECLCDQPCDDAAGNKGVCIHTSTSAACICATPTPSACPCGATCTRPGDTVGLCSAPAGSNVCECMEVPNCPCGAACTTADGEVGRCHPIAGANVCACRPKPPCPCGQRCVDSAGQIGKCSSTDSSPDNCTCVIPTPPPECSCGKECVTTSGQKGKCGPMSSLPPGVCGCVPR